MCFSRSLLMLLVVYIHVAPTLERSVCVIEPLITSPLRYPICPENEINRNATNITNATTPGQQSASQSGNFSENTARINWTTCFVQANPCNASYKYRTFDGSCNNLDHPEMGMSSTVYSRLLPSSYQDNMHSLAMGINGERPASRILRTTLFTDTDQPDTVTLMVMQWGQIVTHDMGFSITAVDTMTVNCCNSSIENYTNVCLPIKVPDDDDFYSQYNTTCLNEARSNVTVINSCNETQPLQQINSVSHALDGSQVYGSSSKKSSSLRELVGGRLKTRTIENNKTLLPNLPQDEMNKTCFIKNITEPCYVAGDDRVNQNPQLSILQTILLREHNRIADKLQTLHKDWNDETVYQEARAIVVAQIQHITYGEWLVHNLGEANMKKYDLLPKKEGYTIYNNTVSLVTINSFIAAANRIAHSGIQGFLKMINYGGITQIQLPISNWMNRPFVVEAYYNNFDELLLGLIHQPMQTLNNHHSEQMTNLAFHDTNPYGVDLVSVDIERGRDHGLGPYVHYLEICTGHAAQRFRDLLDYIPEDAVYKLARHYKYVEDIDLMVGGLLETKVQNTRMGPTFLCIITEQYYRKKWGDRFWYEVDGQPHTFSASQLQEIRKASLSRILCDNANNITTITVNSFLLPSASNKIVPCSSIPEINLEEWK